MYALPKTTLPVARALALISVSMSSYAALAQAADREQDAAPVWGQASVLPQVGPRASTTIALIARTTNTYSSMCGRAATSVRIAKPQPRQGVGIPTPALGAIEFTTELTPGGMCLAAFGPHSTGLTLTRGEALPSIAAGYYAISIDGQQAGVLSVSQNAATVIDFSQLPQ